MEARIEFPQGTEDDSLPAVWVVEGTVGDAKALAKHSLSRTLRTRVEMQVAVADAAHEALHG